MFFYKIKKSNKKFYLNKKGQEQIQIIFKINHLFNFYIYKSFIFYFMKRNNCFVFLSFFLKAIKKGTI